MKAQQGSGLENYGRADQPTRAKELRTKPEEEAVGGVKIGRSAAGALQDQELLLQEDTLSENGPGSASSQENRQSGQQMHQPYNRVFHGQAVCAALDSGAREGDRRCAAPQLRFRHVQAAAWPGNVRELENIIRRLLLGARDLPINEEAVRRAMAARGTAAARRGENNGAYELLIAEAEREILAQAFSAAEGS